MCVAPKPWLQATMNQNQTMNDVKNSKKKTKRNHKSNALMLSMTSLDFCLLVTTHDLSILINAKQKKKKQRKKQMNEISLKTHHLHCFCCRCWMRPRPLLALLHGKLEDDYVFALQMMFGLS